MPFQRDKSADSTWEPDLRKGDPKIWQTHPPQYDPLLWDHRTTAKHTCRAASRKDQRSLPAPLYSSFLLHPEVLDRFPCKKNNKQTWRKVTRLDFQWRCLGSL